MSPDCCDRIAVFGPCARFAAISVPGVSSPVPPPGLYSQPPLGLPPALAERPVEASDPAVLANGQVIPRQVVPAPVGGGAFSVDLGRAPEVLRDLQNARDELEDLKAEARFLGKVDPSSNDQVSLDAATALGAVAAGGPGSLLEALDAGSADSTRSSGRSAPSSTCTRPMNGRMLGDRRHAGVRSSPLSGSPRCCSRRPAQARLLLPLRARRLRVPTPNLPSRASPRRRGRRGSPMRSASGDRRVAGVQHLPRGATVGPTSASVNVLWTSDSDDRLRIGVVTTRDFLADTYRSARTPIFEPTVIGGYPAVRQRTSLRYNTCNVTTGLGHRQALETDWTGSGPVSPSVDPCGPAEEAIALVIKKLPPQK